MMRRRSRFISLVAAMALMLSLLPVGPAAGAVVGSSEAGSQRPAKLSKVTTHAGRRGITVKVSNLEKDVTGIDIYRSETAGVTGTKVNSGPVKGNRFVDESAVPGVQYFYTVKVAGRSASTKEASKDRAKTADVLLQEKANVAKVRKTDDRSARSTRGRAERAEKAPAKRPGAAPAGAVSAMAKTYGLGATVTTLTAAVDLHWTAANSPYFIRSDVVIPAGKTLTIDPGVRVYFDTTASGVATQFPQTYALQSATTDIDLVVHGKIIAKGTSTKPILFTSIRSWSTSATSDALPEEGDWGCLFTDSRDASEISYCTFEFGTHGVWGHNTCRPYVSNSTFTRLPNTSFPWAAIVFSNPWPNSTTPMVKVWNNKVYTEGDGIDVVYDALGYNTLDRVVDFYIANNDITAGYGIYNYVEEIDNPDPLWPVHGGKFGNAMVKGTITGNRILADGGEGVYLYAGANGDGKSASVTTALSNNTINSTSDDAVFVEAYGDGVGSGADAKPTFSGDKIVSSGDDGVDVEAYSDYNGMANYGYAHARPRFTNCQVKSTSYDAVYLNAEADGKGGCSTDAVFTGGTLQTISQCGVEAYADSVFGWASASPSFTNVQTKSWDAYEGIYCEAYTHGIGTAKANPKYVGGSLFASDDDGIIAYAWAEGTGSAQARPVVTNSSIDCYYYGIDAECYSSHGDADGAGTADASPQITNTDMIATYYSPVYADAESYGTGKSTASPVVTGGYLQGQYDGYGVEAYSDSVGGASVASPVLTDVDMLTVYQALYADAYRSGDGDTFGSAIASPKLVGSTLKSGYSNSTVYINADNDGVGNATVKPTVTSTTVQNMYYEYSAMEMYAAASSKGTAEVSPVMKDSTLKSGDEPLYIDCDGPGATGHAKSNGTYTGCTFEAYEDAAAYVYAYDGVTVEASPVFTTCTFKAGWDYACEVYAYAEDPAATSVVAAPTFAGGGVLYSGDGLYIQAYQSDIAGDADVTVAPKVMRFPIVSHWDYAVYTDAYSANDGDTSNNSYIYASPISSYYGIEHDCRAETGDSRNKAINRGVSATDRTKVESTDYSGVYNYCRSQSGSAFNTAQTKYLNVYSYGDGVVNETWSDGNAAEVANDDSAVSGNVMSPLWGFDGDGVETYAYSNGSAKVTAAPSISSNTITGPQDNGVLINTYSVGGQSISKPLIQSNTIFAPVYNGVEIDNDNNTDGSYPIIAKNVITRARLLGVFIDEAEGGYVGKNKIVSPGWGWHETQAINSSGLYWSGGDQWQARVQCNLFTGARGAAIAFANGSGKVNYNSFADCYGNANRPFAIWYGDVAAPATPYDARFNWWGTTNATSIASLVYAPGYAGAKADLVNTGSQLMNCQPLVVGLWDTPSGSNVILTVKFDRWMDTSVTTLKFGTGSPYTTYSVTGTWLNANTFRGTRSAAGLPTGVNMYFSGARDWPGSPMLSTSKAFKL